MNIFKELYEKPELPHDGRNYHFKWSDGTDVTLTRGNRIYVQHKNQVWTLSQDGSLTPYILLICCTDKMAKKMTNMLKWCNENISKSFLD